MSDPIVTQPISWKTKTGGFALIGTGISGLILHFVDPTNAAALGLMAGFTLISSGLVAIGLGHKLEKLTAIIAQIK